MIPLKAPKVGDTIECAIWMTGEEAPWMMENWKTQACPTALKSIIAQADAELVLGPVEFAIKRPGDDRVPHVPDWVHGPDVRLLVGTADIVAIQMLPKPSTFLDTLDKFDLDRLRHITRRAYYRYCGDDLTEDQCDAMIAHLGPESAAAVLAHPAPGSLN